MRIVEFPRENSLALIRFRRCGREFSMMVDEELSFLFNFFLKKKEGGEGRRRGYFLGYKGGWKDDFFRKISFLSRIYYRKWLAIMREI